MCLRAVHSSATTASILFPMATADTSEIVYTFLPSDWEYPGSGTPSNLHWQPAQVRSPYFRPRFPNLNRADVFRGGSRVPVEGTCITVLPVARVPATICTQARTRASHFLAPPPMLDLLSPSVV